MKWILVAGGSCDSQWLKRELDEIFEKESGKWACMGIDSGTLRLLQAGYTPQHVTGDFDSVTPGEKEKILDAFPEKTLLNPVKDDTDTEAAIRLAVSMGAEEIRLYGASGSRLDHTIANIRLLAAAEEAGIPAMIVDPCNRIRLISGDTVIERRSQYGRYISLIPFDGPVSGLTLKGFRYGMDGGELAFVSSLGISNEITDKTGKISFTEGKLLLMETKD